MEWISVKDRLPEVNQKCKVKFIHRSDRFSTMREDGFYCDITRPHVKLKQSSITHWMPLPQPPK